MGDGEHLTSVTFHKDISVGQQIDIISYPNPVLKGVASNFIARITDFFGNPVDSPTDFAGLWYKYQDLWSVMENSEVSSDGFVTFTQTFNSFNYEGFKVVYYWEESDEFLPNFYDDLTAPVVTTSDKQFTKGNISVISIQTNSPYANTPITFSETATGLSTTLYTNSNGYAEYNHIGVGKGYYTYKAKVGNSNEGTLSKSDYLQYWYPNFIRNRKYGMFNNGYLLDLDNSFQLRNENGTFIFLGVDVEDNIPYRLLLTIEAGANQNCSVAYGGTTDVTSSEVYVNWQTLPTAEPLRNTKVAIERNSEGTISLQRGSSIIYTEANQSNRKPVLMFYGQSTNFKINFAKLELRDMSSI